MTKVLGNVDAVYHGTTAPSDTNIIWFKTDNNDPNTWTVVNIYFWSGSEWKAYTDIFSSIEESEDGSPPQDTRKLWKVVTAGAEFVEYRVYDESLPSWVPFLPDKLDALATAANSAKLNGKNEAALLAAFQTAILNTLFGTTEYNDLGEMQDDIESMRLPQVSLSGGKMFAVSDAYTVQDCNNNNQINLGIDLDANVDIPIGSPILIERNNVGKVVIYSVDGVSINGVNQTSFEIKEQWTSCYIRKRGSNAWLIVGNVE